MTYKKIAQLAGVSVSTVSKAMSGSHEIGSETTKRILEIAQNNGVAPPKYHRNRLGTRVAIIVPEINSVYYSSLVTIIAKELEARGIVPCVYMANFDKKKLSRIIDSIIDSGMDGIITLTGITVDKPAAPPTVRLLSESNSIHDTINIDLNSAIFEALEYLCKCGHTDIGFVGEKHTLYKLIAFKNAMSALGLTVSEKNNFVSKKRFEQIGYEAVEYYMKRKKLPTALLCAYDEVAMGAIHAFKAHGIRVPEDISIIGINDIPYAAYAEIPLTTISTADGDASKLAVEFLCERMFELSDSKPRYVLLKRGLIIRETVSSPQGAVSLKCSSHQ